MRQNIFIITILVGLIAVYSCNKPPEKREEIKSMLPKPVHSFKTEGSVREMNIGLENLQFPEHEGRSEFQSYCSMCHSLKYISMQPDFPRKTWEAEVTKMVVKYHAPIDSVTCKKIVDYIVAAKPERN
jgi:hypothetical protein